MEKYCAGVTETTIKQREVPVPITTPAVTKRPPILWVEKPLSISPKARRVIPNRAVFLAPSQRMTLALTTARTEMQAQVKDPTKESVDGEDSFSDINEAWMIPQLYVVPTNQKVMALQPKMTAQP